MKNLLFLLISILIATSCLAQNSDCSQGDGTYKYRAILTENIPVDFDKNDFLDFIVAHDNISSQDLTTLTNGITAVYRSIPSINPHKSVTIDAAEDIYSILDSLDNSLDIFYCVIRDCVQEDNTYRYYATVVEGPIGNDFDKADFIDYIIARDVISTSDLTILTNELLSVEKAFPNAQSDFLQRTLVIHAMADIYDILESLTNSLEFFECISDDIILALEEVPKAPGVKLFPNPVTEQSVLQFPQPSQTVRVELINALGQQLYIGNHIGAEYIALKKLPVPLGISFLKIYYVRNGRAEVIKVVRDR